MQIPLPDYWLLLRTYMQPHLKKVVPLGLLLFASIGLQLYLPQVLRGFIDTVTGGGAMRQLLNLALLFIALGILNQLLQAVTTYVSQDVAWSTTNDLRSDLVRHCLRLDMEFHKQHTPGTMVERIDGDVNALANFFSQFVLRLLGSSILLLGVLALLWREDWRMGALMMGFSALNFLLINRMRSFSVPKWTAERKAHADLFSFIEERLAGTEDIRANGAERYVKEQLDNQLLALLRTGRTAWLYGAVVWPTTMLFFTLASASALALSGTLYWQGAMTIGTVFLLFSYAQMLQRPLEELSRQMEELQKAGGSIARIQELLRLESRIGNGAGAVLPAGPLAVDLAGVTFAYEDGEKVLHDLTFHLAPGRILGLLGRTGSGKTTVIRLINRLYDPIAGEVRLGGVDIRQVAMTNLRKGIGVVTQDVQLFHGSLRDNLTFFDPSIPDERILAVIRELGLWRWYQGLADGLDTVLQSGGGLSAGEAQLLAFTRIFLRDPGLVIMDEASSRLDPVTEQLTEHAVDRLLQGRTGIVIAHRLSTVERADEIMILDNGHIVEHGDRLKLAADPSSRFYGLLQTGMEEALA
jgi:ATP-binding cassette subfamily B protein